MSSNQAPPSSDKTGSGSAQIRLPESKTTGFQRSGYISCFKLQQQRIRGLNQLENQADSKKIDQKSLPKISQLGPDKENLVIREAHRSNTIDVIKLPGVRGGYPASPPIPAPTQKRKTLPVKTYHLRVNPDHTSFISKSLPSLPSIPGSPSYPEDLAVSPMTERVDKDKMAVPIYPTKHRFEKIVFQKHIHRDGITVPISEKSQADSSSSKRTSGHRRHLPQPLHLPAHLQSARVLDKPHTSGSVRLRFSKVPSEVVISETQSEPSFEISRKWKENCSCLRCQMLRRQYQEGDSHYGLWGRYPCHHVDPSIMLDD